LSKVGLEGGGNGVRVNKLVRVMLGLVDTVVEGVSLDLVAGVLTVRVRPKSSALGRCGVCGRRCPGHDRGPGVRRWRAPDVGWLQVFLEAAVPRVRCPQHRVVLARVPWARHAARHTRDFEDLTAWLARHTAKSTVAHFMRVSWRSVGSMVTRVLADLDAAAGDRWQGIRRIGIDEISYRRGHKYLTVVVDHDTGQLLWMHPGRTKRSLGKFFERLGPDQCAQLRLVSADGADWIAEVVALNAPNAKRCMDPFHVVKWGVEALDTTRRQVAAEARRTGQDELAKALGAGCRFALWKNPADLTTGQQATLADIERLNQPVFRAYLLKEQLRAVFHRDGDDDQNGPARLDAWIAAAADSGLPAYVRLSERIEDYSPEIKNALEHRLSNARVESINTKIRLITRIAFGFRSPDALIALAMLHLGGYDLHLPGRIRA
jgi:transposase